MGSTLLIDNLKWLVLLGLLTLFFRHYLVTYVAEKGKNKATKEDIEEITKRVEGVRGQFLAENEKLRAQLSKLVNVHRVQFEKEFSILSDIWAKLVDLRNATLALPAPGGIIGRPPSHEQQLQQCADSWMQLRAGFEMNRPFFPQRIYDELQTLIKISL